MANAWDFGTNTGAGLWGNNRAARDAEWAKVGLNPSGRYPGFDLGKRGIVGLFPTIGQQVSFAGEMEPIREQMIRNFITQNSPSNANYLVDSSRRNALSQAMAGQNQMAVNGFGGGFTDPSSAIQAGNEAGANAFSMVHSPEFQNGLYQNVLGAVNQGQNISMLPAAEAFHGLTLSTPRNQSGLAAVGNILGQGLSSFMSGGMSGGSHSGSPVPSGGGMPAQGLGGLGSNGLGTGMPSWGGVPYAPPFSFSTSGYGG